MKNCKGVLGFVFGHKFVHVITKSAAKCGLSVEGTTAAMLGAIDASRDQTYQGIYCVRCGEVVKK